MNEQGALASSRQASKMLALHSGEQGCWRSIFREGFYLEAGWVSNKRQAGSKGLDDV